MERIHTGLFEHVLQHLSGRLEILRREEISKFSKHSTPEQIQAMHAMSEAYIKTVIERSQESLRENRLFNNSHHTLSIVQNLFDR